MASVAFPETVEVDLTAITAEYLLRSLDKRNGG
jgi:hypothetical protein